MNRDLIRRLALCPVGFYAFCFALYLVLDSTYLFLDSYHALVEDDDVRSPLVCCISFFWQPLMIVGIYVGSSLRRKPFALLAMAPRADHSLPKPWERLVDESGYYFYWNPETDETQYERPTCPPPRNFAQVSSLTSSYAFFFFFFFFYFFFKTKRKNFFFFFFFF